jgi:hypothetical protein
MMPWNNVLEGFKKQMLIDTNMNNFLFLNELLRIENLWLPCCEKLIKKCHYKNERKSNGVWEEDLLSTPLRIYDKLQWKCLFEHFTLSHFRQAKEFFFSRYIFGKFIWIFSWHDWVAHIKMYQKLKFILLVISFFSLSPWSWFIIGLE